MPKTVLSTMPDGLGFYYGFSTDPADHRQINLRYERDGDGCRAWAFYVDGELLGYRDNFFHAEGAALKWMREHPVT